MKVFKRVLTVVLILALVVLVGFLGVGVYKKYFTTASHPVVTFEVENYGTVKMELYPEYAPNTVANIIKLVESGYYDGKLIFGRDEICLYAGRSTDNEIVVPKASLIDPNVKEGSEQDIEYQIAGEFVANGYEENILSHEKGVVSLIRYDYAQQIPTLTTESYNSGNAQLGFMLTDARDLNGLYSAFGKVTEGLDIIEKIALEDTVEVTEEEDTGIDEFEKAPVITKATVDTFGKDYGVPAYEEYFDFQTYLQELMSQYYTTELQ